jgi:cysteine synthase A
MLDAPCTPQLAPEVAARLAGLDHLVGNTPLVAVDYTYRNQRGTIYAKCEQMNFTGSLKDRMALNILREAYASGAIRSGDTIAEATSGNTGIALAALGRALGHPVKIFMPDWMSQERLQLVRSYGAEIHPVTRSQGGFIGSIAMCEALAREHDDVFLPNQFANQANVRAHRLGTGPEIWEQLAALNLVPDAFVAGVGTGGTVMGTGQFLRSKNPAVHVYPVEPAESPTLSTGCKVGSHRIQGISDDFIPAVVDLSVLDAPLSISDGDSILMAQRIAGELGLGVGISSGCNLLAAITAQQRLGPGSVVVTIFCDDNKKYLSTALLGDEPVRESYMTPEIKLCQMRSYPRCR